MCPDLQILLLFPTISRTFCGVQCFQTGTNKNYTQISFFTTYHTSCVDKTVSTVCILIKQKLIMPKHLAFHRKIFGISCTMNFKHDGPTCYYLLPLSLIYLDFSYKPYFVSTYVTILWTNHISLIWILPKCPAQQTNVIHGIMCDGAGQRPNTATVYSCNCINCIIVTMGGLNAQ